MFHDNLLLIGCSARVIARRLSPPDANGKARRQFQLERGEDVQQCILLTTYR
jgi:uncharacterized protein (DUF1015 family)